MRHIVRNLPCPVVCRFSREVAGSGGAGNSPLNTEAPLDSGSLHLMADHSGILAPANPGSFQSCIDMPTLSAMLLAADSGMTRASALPPRLPQQRCSIPPKRAPALRQPVH